MAVFGIFGLKKRNSEKKTDEFLIELSSTSKKLTIETLMKKETGGGEET